MQVSHSQQLICIFVTLNFIGQFESAPMEERDQAKLLYKKARENDCLGPSEQADVRNTVKKLIQKSLNRLDSKARFQYKEFPSMIKKTALCGKFVVHKTSTAFILLEKYLILLLTLPWKTEYHKLKTYCGFFQCRVKSHLEDAENVFKLINFRESNNSTDTLVMYGKCDQDLILDVAFECVLASVECDLISDHYTKISDMGGTIMDAVACRLEGRNFEMSRRKPSEHVDCVNTCQRPVLYPDVVEPDLKQRGVPNIPKLLYIDDDLDDATAEVAPTFQMGTLDEHVMASLQKLKTQPPRNQQIEPAHGDEWLFVRTGLERKYGKSYYDGIRGDVINPNNNSSSSNRHADMQRRQPQDPDDISDEGIDVHEGPAPVRLNPLSHRAPRQLPNAADPASFAAHSKSLQTSGYRTGMYSQPITSTYQPSTVVCDEAPLSPEIVSSANVLVSSSNCSTRVGTHPAPSTDQSLLKQTEPATIAVLENPRTFNFREHGNINNLSNIALLSRSATQSAAFRKEKLPNRGSNTAYLELGVLVERWVCEKCTTENTSKSKICDVCGKSRFVPDEMDGPRIGESVRICSQCTLENTPGSSVCVACNAVLVPNNINTYV